MIFMCKPLFIDLEEELKKALETSLKNENVEKAASDKPVTVSKFKSYNKDLQMDNRHYS